MIRTRFKAAKFIAKSSGISRKYGEDIKRIGFPCKHELMFAMIRNEPLNCVSFFRCLRRPLAESHFSQCALATDDGRAYAMERATSVSGGGQLQAAAISL